MNNLYQKLFSTSILNALSAGINFLSNYIIVQILSLSIFGEFAVFSSFVAFGGLIYIIIPPNFSVFKLQDDKEFEYHLARFFMLSSVVYLAFAVATNLFVFKDIPLVVIYLFGFTTNLLAFFDIKFKAIGQIQRYFQMLFFLAIIKILTILIFYFINILDSLTNLLWSITIAQSLILLAYLYTERKIIKSVIQKPSDFKETICFIINSIKIFSPYYLNTVLKKIRENSIILIFSKFVSSETMGLFALFVKVDSFVLGLSRNIEALFMNRTNMASHKTEFYQNAMYFSFLLQAIYLVVGITYMKIIANQFYLIEIFIQSLLVHPHVFFLVARAELLSKYNNNEINISESIYILVVIIGFVIGLSINSTSLYSLLITYIIAKFGLQAFMIVQNRKKNVQITC